MFDNINMKKFAAYTALTMVAAFILSAVIFFSTGGVDAVIEREVTSKQNVNIEKVFAADGINTISVDTSSTDVHFIPEQRSDIKVHLIGRSDSSEPELRAEQNGDTLDIYTRNRSKGTFFTIGINVINLRLDIYVPADYMKNIKVNSSSGDLELGKLGVENFTYKSSSGDLRGEDFTAKSSSIRTSSGDVRTGGFGGDLELETSSGDAVIEYALKGGKADITTSSGDIRLVNFSGDLNTKAQSGDIKIDYAAFNNNIEMRSSSGEIELNLPSESQFGIRVNTSSGDIRTDFAVALSGEIDEDKLEGSVGSGNGKIAITTSSGDVKIRKK